jgi:hypothetical protein
VNGLAFPTILSAHTLGMGFLAGTSIGIDLRLLGAAQRVPLAALDRFYPVIWIALAVNFASGILLLIGYPYKAFTNPVFYLKIALIVIAVYLIVLIRQTVLNSTNLGQPDALRRGKLLALSSLGCWIGVIAAGRLLAYTYSWLSVGIPNNL